ncbi:MAG: type II toxin-antitoxin system HicB family antitoxin [Planctomycetes bacterium]|nr:type II toxin-antitoxin system HicB family antitoxin [Planctomycetota bacterium]
MLEYHAAYFEGDDGWIVAIVLDFPGANSQGRTLRSARRMIRDALRLMAETHIEMGEPLPTPNPKAKAKKAIFTETIPVSVRVPMKVPL